MCGPVRSGAALPGPVRFVRVSRFRAGLAAGRAPVFAPVGVGPCRWAAFPREFAVCGSVVAAVREEGASVIFGCVLQQVAGGREPVVDVEEAVPMRLPARDRGVHVHGVDASACDGVLVEQGEGEEAIRICSDPVSCANGSASGRAYAFVCVRGFRLSPRGGGHRRGRCRIHLLFMCAAVHRCNGVAVHRRDRCSRVGLCLWGHVTVCGCLAVVVTVWCLHEVIVRFLRFLAGETAEAGPAGMASWQRKRRRGHP